MQNKYILFLPFLVHFSIFAINILEEADQGNINAMYAIGNKLCQPTRNSEKCKNGLKYLWLAHLNNHPNAINQFIYYSLKNFKYLSTDEQQRLYKLKNFMSASQKITIAKLLITSHPTKAKTIYLELTKQNNHIAQWDYIQFSFIEKYWELNGELVVKFLNNLQKNDELSRLILAELYAQGFLVEKNPKLFRSLGSTVWRKLSNEPENLRKMIHKAKTMVKLGRQKYELNRKINGSK